MKKKTLFASPLRQFISVIFALFVRELKTRFGQSRFGVVWTLAEPAVHIIVLLFIFVFIRDRMMPQVPFELFLVTGLIPMFIFRSIITSLMGAVSANKALFAYSPVKPIDTYIARALLEIVIYSVIFSLIMLYFWLWGGLDVSIANPFLLMAVFFIIVVMAFALGVCASILCDIFPVTKIVVNILNMVLYFGSAIMYPLWIVPSNLLEYLKLNPLLHLIELFRRAFFSYYPNTDGINIYYPLFVTLIALFIALYFYRYRRFALAAKS